LQQQVKLLQEQIEFLKIGTLLKQVPPPSQDLGRSNQRNLRNPSIRKSGGQPNNWVWLCSPVVIAKSPVAVT